MKRLDLAPFTLRMWKNATCLRDHFAQYDFKKSPPFWKFAMKLWIIQCLPLFISCTIAEFCVTSSLSLDNWGQKYCQTLGKPVNSNFFCTDLPRNFWKIARVLGKIKNTITLRFISLYFLSKKSSSERTCPYWQWIVFTIKIRGQWPVPMVWKKTIHAVCGRDNNNYYYFPKGKFKLFNSLFHSTYSCTLCFQCIWFLLPICLPCVICGTYEMRI